jgi:hypothetical protein
VRWKLERGGFHPKSEDGPEIEQAIGKERVGHPASVLADPLK